MFGRNDREYSDSLIREAENEYRNDNFEKAIKLIDRVLRESPRNIKAHRLKSDILFNTDDFEGALKELKFIESLEPSNAINYSLESLCYGSMSMFEKSLEYAEKAIHIDPYYAPAYYNKGFALQSMDLLNEAQAAYEIAIEKNSSDPDTHRQLANVLFQQGNIKKAKKEAEIALRFNKKDVDANLLLVNISRLRDDMGKYVESITKAFDNTHDYVFFEMLIEELMEAGQLSEAERLAQVYYDHQPDILSAAETLANVYQAQGNIEKADSLFRNFVDKHEDEDTVIEYMEFLYSGGKYEKLVAEAEEFIKKYPESEELFFEKYDALLGLKRNTEAFDVIEKQYSLNMDNASYGLEYAKRLAENGKEDKAVELLKNIQKNHDHLKIYEAFFEIYSRGDDLDNAMKYAYISMEKSEDSTFNIEFPASVINWAMEKNHGVEALSFIDSLLNKSGGNVHNLYMLYRAAILSITSGYEDAIKEINKITNRKNIRYDITIITTFGFETLNEFLKKVLNDLRQ